VLDDDALDHRLDYVPISLRQLGHGLELQAQFVGGAALVLVEHQRIGADRERNRHVLEHIQRRLCAAGLVAAQLHHVDAGFVGQLLLGESARFE